ncbi:MAG: hypothetical protein DRN06_07505 [Thermoprotei archaeon]|nr:MAG: hypothetical protein DRN06_07505 [Thermoprotei archaeon]
MKLQEATELIISYFGQAETEVIKHVARQGEEYFKIRARLDDVILDVREYWIGSELCLYGYQMLIGGRPVLRYNNVPHHPEVSTFPHHKHVEGHVEELRKPSLRAFLEEVMSFLRA